MASVLPPYQTTETSGNRIWKYTLREKLVMTYPDISVVIFVPFTRGIEPHETPVGTLTPNSLA